MTDTQAVIQAPQGYCRDCSRPATPPRCPHCLSPRLVSHGELDHLTIAHIDCDAFYASVEKRDRPELQDRPVIVGGGRRGVVATACYLARIKGVHSAMPMFKALKACPDAVVIRPDMARYMAVSRQIRTIFAESTPAVQPISIDEAFLDLTGTERVHGAAAAVTLTRLARRIEAEIGVTVSIGLSHNRFLAKIASDLDKPRGFSVIGRAETLDFLKTQPVSIIMGVGKAFQRRLRHDGITHVGQLQTMEEADLLRRYGSMGGRLYQLARGIDARTVSPRESRKSISTERTFADDLTDPAALEGRLWTVCEEVSRRAKDSGLAGQSLTLKLKTDKHKIITRSHSFDRPVAMANQLFNAAAQLLAGETGTQAYRLIGVGISDLVARDQAGTLDLIDEHANKRNRAEAAMDTIRTRFGEQSIMAGRGFLPGQTTEKTPS